MKGIIMFDRVKKFVNENKVEIAFASVVIAAVATVVITKKMSPAKDSILLEVPMDAVKGMIDGGNSVLFDVDVDFGLMVSYIPNHH